MDVRTAIRAGDAQALRALLAQDPGLADALVPFKAGCAPSHHPLHYVCDAEFEGLLSPEAAVRLVEALVEGGSSVNYHSGETALIAAASLYAEDVGLRLLDLGADPALLGGFGETALHWAGLCGLNRLTMRLIPLGDVNQRDSKYESNVLGWALHGWQDAPAARNDQYYDIVRQLVGAGARVEAEWRAGEKVRADPLMVSALERG